MKRREFIGMAAAGAAGLVLPTVVRGEASVSTVLASPQLLEILRDERAVRELGQCYRQIVPAENDPQALTQAIRGQSAAAPATAGALRAQVNKTVRGDFAEGRTITLKGWVLSVTEARQCALYSLLPA
jgi:hypothetical protein